MAKQKLESKNEKDKLSDIIVQLNKIYNYHDALDNHFEALHYKKAIEKLTALKKSNLCEKNDIQIEKCLENNMEKIGIGKNIGNKILEYIDTGKISILESFKKDPKANAILNLTKVLGIGKVMANKLYIDDINNVDELRKAFNKGKVKLNDMQIIGLKYFDTLNEKISKNEIDKYLGKMKKAFPKYNFYMAGSYRRKKDNFNDIDIIVLIPGINDEKDINKNQITIEKFYELLKDKGLIKDIVLKSNYGLMAINENGRQLDLKISPKNLLPFFCLYFGSGEVFSRYIRKIAKDKGYKLTQWGIFKGKKNLALECKFENEKDIFKFLGIDFVNANKR